MLSYVLILLGFVFLIAGADVLVKGSVAIAHRLNISKLIIGLTIVALGTSAPELFVSVKASLSGSSGIALGNVIGSNIANVALILAVTALVAPVLCDKKEFLQNYSFLFISTFLLCLFLFIDKELYLVHGLIFIITLIGYLVFSYVITKRDKTASIDNESEENTKKYNLLYLIVMIALGLSGLVFGANLLVNNSIIIAKNFGISEEVIGLTLVAVGTSLPELATSIVAAVKKQHQIILGNIIGSNIWNILLILGVSSVISPIHAAPQIIKFDLIVLIFTTVMLFPLALKNNKLSRLNGLFFLLCYALYIVAQYFIVKGKFTGLL